MLADRVRPLRRREYDRLVEMGLLADEKVELIRGFIVRMSPQGSAHGRAIERLTRLLIEALPRARAAVRIQLPLALSDDSEPEPDIAVVPPGSSTHGHPSRAFIVMEVSDSSLVHDRVEKGALYAEAGIPEYWIVDAAHQRVEVHSDIAEGAYSRVTPYRRGDVARSVSLPDLEVAIDEIFG